MAGFFDRIKAILQVGTTDVGNANPVPVSDAGGSLTVDGTVAVTNASLTTLAGAVAGTEVQVDVLTLPQITIATGGLPALSSTTDSIDASVATVGYGQTKLDSSDVTTAQVLVAAVAAKKFYITSLILSVAVAGAYWIEDDDAAQITCKFTLDAKGGCVQSFPINTPFKSTTAAKGLKVKGSAAGVVGCMITYYTLA